MTRRSKTKHEWQDKTRQPGLKRLPERPADFTTISGVPIEPLYSAEDLPPGHTEEKVGFPGEYPYTRGIHPSLYRGKLWTMRQFSGFGTPEETNARYKFLLAGGQTGLSVAFDLPTLMGLRLRRPAGRRRGGQVRRGHRHPGRHGDPLRRHRHPGHHHLHDHQLARRRAPGHVRRGGREAGRRPAAISGHHPERHPQGVHRPEGVDLPARAVHAPGGGHLRVVRPRAAEVELHLHQRLPHPRGRLHGGPGAGLHPARRHRVRRGGHRARPGRGRLRAPAVVLLQRPQRLLRGDRQVPRRPPHLGAGDARALPRQEPGLVAAALPHPDRRAAA